MGIYHKIKNSEGFKITSINSISVLVKIISGIITSKVLALLTGPQGMALLGNFRNFSATIESVATLGFQNGIVKYVADYQQNPKKLQDLYATLLVIIFSVCLLLGIGIFVFSTYWNTLIFGNNYSFTIVFKIMAFALPISILGSFMIAIINGFNNYKAVIYSNTIANGISLLVTVILVYYWGTKGAIVSVVFTSVILFFIVLYYFTKEQYLDFVKKIYCNSSVLKELSHYLVMIVISGVLGQVLQIYIRNLVITHSTIETAGYWEAMNRISSNYMLFINTILSIYYYPKLIQATNSEATKSTFLSYYKTIIPLFVLGALVVYILRFYLVKLLLSNAFEEVTTLFFWQLVGDFFKTISWILGFQFLAKRMTKEFLFFELISFLVLWMASFYFIPLYKDLGAVMAFALSYGVYYVVLLIYFRRIFWNKA